ncbi:hypothetical protein RHMOL_Rhmol13G0281900 [Rhododendron molle]|uniref:Uncharacterized protein n=1 Tax=Rhododendron molle TaxID=49168 RepID=A0ACC0LD61_RHOML|nr:hypothetical protein RHMOL_Rhmol13G0281900 [Rhododendron molle]
MVCNFKGEVLDMNYGRIKVSSAITAEAWSVRVARAMAIARGFESVVIDSDCKEPAKACPKGSGAAWEVQTSLADLVILLEIATVILNGVIGRSANKCVHYLAKKGMPPFHSPTSSGGNVT